MRLETRTTIGCVVLFGVLVGALSGCATQRLALMDAKIVPAKLTPGEDALLCVKVIDPKGVVAAVVATVREYPTITLELNDIADEGDKDAGDGVWSAGKEVPGEAEPGLYNWDFAAYDTGGDPIKVATETGAEKRLAAETSVEIVY